MDIEGMDTLMMLSSGFAMVLGLLAPVAHSAGSFLVGDVYGVESMLGLHAATTIVSALIGAVSFALLIVGIAKLARPPAETPA